MTSYKLIALIDGDVSDDYCTVVLCDNILYVTIDDVKHEAILSTDTIKQSPHNFINSHHVVDVFKDYFEDVGNPYATINYDSGDDTYTINCTLTGAFVLHVFLQKTGVSAEKKIPNSLNSLYTICRHEKKDIAHQQSYYYI